jgi:hypothetical protein
MKVSSIRAGQHEDGRAHEDGRHGTLEQAATLRVESHFAR